MFTDQFWIGLVIGLVAGVLIGWVTLWSYLNPMIGRIVGRIVAIAAIANGIAWIITPNINLAFGDKGRDYDFGTGKGDYAMAIGNGAGWFIFGVLALVLSFLHIRKKAAPPKEEPQPRTEEPRKD
jgi:hypothetical protein